MMTLRKQEKYWDAIRKFFCQLLLAKASELVAVLHSTREWSFIETQRLAG